MYDVEDIVENELNQERIRQLYVERAEHCAKCGNYYDAVINAAKAGRQDLVESYLNELARYHPTIAEIIASYLTLKEAKSVKKESS
jgi:hypothetical protein